MIEVHHLNNSRSQQILWLLEDFPGVYLPALLLAGIAFTSRARST